MTEQEFTTWLRHATAAYPEIGNQFKGDQATERAIIWASALSKVSLDVATEAINSMVVGTVEHPKFGWSDLPKFVLEYGKERANVEAQQERYRSLRDDEICPKCHNLQCGCVTVWNPWFVEHCFSRLCLCSDKQEAFRLWQSWRKLSGTKGDAMRLTVLCNCSINPVAVRRRARLQEWSDGTGSKTDKHVPVVKDTYCESMHIWINGDPKEVTDEQTD